MLRKEPTKGGSEDAKEQTKAWCKELEQCLMGALRRQLQKAVCAHQMAYQGKREIEEMDTTVSKTKR